MNLIRRPLLGAAAALAPLVIPLAASAFTLGSGRPATQSRQVAPFQSVASAGDIDLRITQGPQQLSVSTDDNLLPLLETVVEGSGAGATLKLRWKRGASVHERSKTRVTIAMPRLDAIALAGTGDVEVDRYRTPALELRLSGAGDARLNAIETASLRLRVAGSGDVTASGQATSLQASVSGSGDLHLMALRADDVRLRIAGSGDAAVHADRTLDVSIAGSGDVEYSGNARVSSHVAGSGSVKKR
ncbi:MAG: DUF2807 domain-containing protein [Burkholderiales bacterium]|nr:DUF2807 domain-containing protein [Burkholderiales bacterium]